MWLGAVEDSSAQMSATVRPLPPPGRSTDDTSQSGTSGRSSCPRRGKLRYSAADARIVSVDHQFFTARYLAERAMVSPCLTHGSLNAGTCITILPGVPHLEQQATPRAAHI